MDVIKKIIKILLVLNLIYFKKCKSETHLKLNINLDKDEEKKIWFYKFLIILFNYSTILVPIFLLVYLIKNKICLSELNKSSLLYIFIYGKQISNLNNDLEMQENLMEKEVNQYSNKKSSYFNLISLTYCFFGLQISYLIWGLVQEKIMITNYTRKSTILINNNLTFYKKENFNFRDSQFLVLTNRILTFFISLIIMLILNFKSRVLSKKIYRVNLDKKLFLIAPLYEFVYCSVSNVLSSVCQYEALKFVNFPTQVLSKSCKMLAVMLMSKILNKTKYKKIEYVFVFFITFGMTMFLFGNQYLHEKQIKKFNLNENKHNFFVGIIILLIYVTFDAFTSNWQGKLFDKYKISSLQMMTIVSFYSTLFTFVSLTENGDLVCNLKLVYSSKELFRDCLILSVTSASGQFFVYYTISKFGPLIFTIIMTLRQTFAISLSCIIYGHEISKSSLLGIFIVFTTLFSQIYYKFKNKSTLKK